MRRPRTCRFQMAGYQLAHHGEGRWNGVAIASRVGIADVVTTSGDGPVRPLTRPRVADRARSPMPSRAEASVAPGDEARMISAVCGGVRVVSIYAPNGRALDTPVLSSQAGLVRPPGPLAARNPGSGRVAGGRRRFQRRARGHGRLRPARLRRRHARLRAEREAVATLRDWGLVDAYRLHHPEPGKFKLVGLPSRQLPQRPGGCASTTCTRPARGCPLHRRRDRPRRPQGQLPSDHAPVYIDLAD